jgi:hypothetical protein
MSVRRCIVKAPPESRPAMASLIRVAAPAVKAEVGRPSPLASYSALRYLALHHGGGRM